MKLKPLIRAFLFIAYSSSFIAMNAQSRKIDSLRAVLKTEKEDTVKVKTLNECSILLAYGDEYSAADSFARAACALAGKLEYKPGLVSAYRNMGVAYWYKGDNEHALDKYQKALSLAVETGVKQDIAQITGNIGLVYESLSDYLNAQEYYLKALQLFRDIGNKTGQANYLSNLGVICRKQGDYPKALEYYFQAMKMDDEMGAKPEKLEILSSLGILYDVMGDSTRALEYDFKAEKMAEDIGQRATLARIICNIAIVFDGEGNHAKALNYFFKALAIVQGLNDKAGIALNTGNIGLEYSEQGKFDSALKYEIIGLRLKRELGVRAGIATVQGGIGDLYLKEKKYGVAGIYLDSALLLAKQVGDKFLTKETYGNLAILDSSTGNMKKAFDDYKQFIVYRDSLKNEENTKKIVKEQMTYDFDKKQAAEKAEQDKKDAVTEQERKKQLVIRNSFIAGFALVLALAFFIFRGYRQKQKANEIITGQKKEIEQQKAIVEEKQKEILDSIHYAQRIQKALLASNKLLEDNLGEHFVLYRPKDIVSGDFYWATKSDGRFYLAVCDSTGHGVPGAFMSLLNISFLNEAINEKGIVMPGEVFNHARKRLIENISQDGQQDGMDGILASFNTLGAETALNLKYAAAYNTPVIMRNGEIVELPSDKMPVGRSPKENEAFTSYSVNLKKGDMLYLFTDGYADQFGGMKGKKFMYKQLKESLQAIALLGMNEQKARLEKIFNNWKGMLEQVDDVCVIGIRI